MGHEHNVRDLDARFTIDPVTKQIKNESKKKLLLAQGDHNSEIYGFRCPRYIESHDMSLCNKVEVHFFNYESQTKKVNSGKYTVEDLQIGEDEDTVEFSWTISGNGTQLEGYTEFLIRFKCVDENNIVTYAWNTLFFSDVTVGRGSNVDELFETEYVDIIEQWKASVLQGFEDEFEAWKEKTERQVAADINQWKQEAHEDVDAYLEEHAEQWDNGLANANKQIGFLSNYVTPQMYGAKGDGVTDDTEAFELALENSNCLFVPKGTYIVSKTLEISKLVCISGEGFEHSVIKYTGSGYLFDVSTKYNKSALIEKVCFTGGNNSFLKCSCGSWGGKVVVRDFRLTGFHNEVFHFESTFNPIVENGFILSNGKIVFTTYDGTTTETNFNNCPHFSNVYISKYSEALIPVMFELHNVRDITFYKCQLENADIILSGSNKVRLINFLNCWFENIGSIFSFDETCDMPNAQGCNYVNVTSYNANEKVIDRILGRGVLTQKTEGTSGLKTLLQNSIELERTSIYNPNDGYSQYTNVYKIGTDGTDFNQPLNRRSVMVNNSNSASYNLHTILKYSGVGCLFDVTAIVNFSDDSMHIINTKIVSSNNSFTICDINILKSVKWAGSIASTAVESITCENGELTLVSTAEIMARCRMIIDFNFYHL